MVLVAGKMYRPTDVAVDVANDSVYVVEQFNHRISKWEYTAGSFTFTLDASWGSNSDGTSGVGAPVTGVTDNALYRPTGIVFDGTRLVVTDTFHNRIRTLAIADGAWIGSTGQGGSDTADFYHPAGIATDGTTLVIADELNHRALKYTVAATPTTPVLLPAPTPLGFNRPHGVSFEDTNNFFNVTDTSNGVINRYNTAATSFIAQFGTPGTESTELFFPSSGHGILTGNATTAFADTRNNILKTVATSTIANTTGTTAGVGDGQLYYPESVNSFTDTSNYVLVANTLNNRVETFSNTAAALTSETPFNFGTP